MDEEEVKRKKVKKMAIEIAFNVLLETVFNVMDVVLQFLYHFV